MGPTRKRVEEEISIRGVLVYMEGVSVYNIMAWQGLGTQKTYKLAYHW